VKGDVCSSQVEGEVSARWRLRWWPGEGGFSSQVDGEVGARVKG
jgi:hypothetical protein